MGEGSQHSGVGLGLRGNQGLGMGGRKNESVRRGRILVPLFTWAAYYQHDAGTKKRREATFQALPRGGEKETKCNETFRHK